MRILITGASGAMGYYLARYIKSKQIGEVFGIGRRLEANCEYIDRYDRIDISREPKDRIADYIRSVGPEVIFHLAAMANVRDSFTNPENYFQNNIDGTLNFFEALALSGCRPRVILGSTSEVYGNVPQRLNPICETAPIKPVNPYAITKCSQEHIAGFYSTACDFPLVITRAFGYINPKRADLVATVIAKQLVECERGERGVIYHGDLTPVRSFCDVRDIAEAYWLATTVPPGAYNIGNERPCRIAELVSILKGISAVKPEFREVEYLKRPTDIFHAVPDVLKFRRVARWTPKISLHESLVWLMEGLRQTCAA